MRTVGQWVHSRGGQRFVSEGFADRDAAIADGRIAYNGEVFFVAQVDKVATRASAFAPVGSVVEAMSEDAAVRFGESADGWLTCDVQQAEELRNTLRVKVDQWADTHGLHPEFYRVGMPDIIDGRPSAASETPAAPDAEAPTPWERDNLAISECLLWCGLVVSRDQVAARSNSEAEAAHEWATAVIHNAQKDVAKIDVPAYPSFLDQYPTREAKPAEPTQRPAAPRDQMEPSAAPGHEASPPAEE